jgi:hypothetical protein
MGKRAQRARPVPPGALRLGFVLLCSILIIGIVACSETDDQGIRHAEPAPSKAPERLAGHEEMLAALAEIAERTSDENDWLGDAEFRRARARFAALPEDASAHARWRAHTEVAKHESRLGNEAAAIEHFRSAYRLLPELKDRIAPSWVNYTVFRLAVSHMRLGETQNCCQRGASESCILPIRGDGIHTKPEGSKQAIKYLREVFEASQPQSAFRLKARWLLNIAYMTIGGYPEDVAPDVLIAPAVFESEEAFPRFHNVAGELGLDTFSLCGGLIVDDFTGDGYFDILTSTHDTRAGMHFFKNMRDGSFSEQTEKAGLAGLYGGLNLVQADYNNDGKLDVFVPRGAWYATAGQHPNSLLKGRGNGTFVDVTFDAGLGRARYPTQTAAWADYDNDGDLDLYVGNEHSGAVTAPCQLHRNGGDGTFTDVAREARVENLRFTKAVVWGDYDNDRWPDLYVSNLGAPNRLYRNNGDGTFQDVAPRLGVTRPIQSFPAWFWDFDNDGALDLYVSSYNGERDAVATVAASYLGKRVEQESACLYRGDGRGGFDEVASQRGLHRVTLPMGSNFGDLDGDGFLDFYLGTGYPDYEALMPNVMYRNISGQRFQDVTFAGGFGHLQKGHAISFADIDHDGDQDVFEQMGGNYPGDKFRDALFENPGFGNRWLALQVVGDRSNRSAIGARIHVEVTEAGRRRSIYKHVNSGGSFGANPLRQTIGLGRASRIDQLEVYWPTTDRMQTFREVPMDQFLRITEGEDRFVTLKLPGVTVSGTPARRE